MLDLVFTCFCVYEDQCVIEAEQFGYVWIYVIASIKASFRLASLEEAGAGG